MNLAFNEFKRLAARLAELQEYSDWRLGLFSWYQPSASTRDEHPGLSLSDACGYLSVETNSIALYQSTLWRHATSAVDDKGDPIYEGFVDADGQPVIVEGQQLLVPQLEEEERRGIVLTDSSLPPEPTLFLRSMRGNGGESRLLPQHKVLLELLEQAGHTLRGTFELMQLLWNDNLPAQTVNPLVLWISSVVELAHRRELIGDLVQQGWWWWKSPSGRAMCESQIIDCEDDREEFDHSRQACQIKKPVAASCQTIEWLLQHFVLTSDVLRIQSQMHTHISSSNPSIFISYSHKDEEFAQKIYSRLITEGFEVWYAAEDMKGGQTIYEQIDKAITRHDRLLLILSETSMKSAWVQTEIRKARKRSTIEDKRILFPISLVPYSEIKVWECFDSDTGTDMATEIREFFIPTFQDWENSDEFSKAFTRLVKDLRAVEADKDHKHPKPANSKLDSIHSLVEKVRELAKRVRSLPDQIINTFSIDSSEERVRHVNEITSTIHWDSIPLITWIERNRADSADLEKRRFAVVEHDAELCASMKIPEYQGGVINPRPDGVSISEGARKVAELLVFCIAFEQALVGWAEEIEHSV